YNVALALENAARLGEAEAIRQWELSGHDFFLFLDPAGRPAVLYRRHDGSVGLLRGEAQA
ncbi:sigma 54 modulation/S30EA ribosomal C-terminal domain-containing protein, partial [bacterium]|nr:sigma 54 modulation/S30EA ribosomal C-terminal domain-containing protein [bacterium]